MQTVTIKNITLGGGKTAICAPVMGRTADDIREALLLAAGQRPDMLEWRADYFEHAQDAAVCVEVLRIFRAELPDMPVLFTLRTAAEGGAQDIPRDVAVQVYGAACRSGLVDLIDTERTNDADFLHTVMEEARCNGVKVVLSRHHFDTTPARDDIVQALCNAQALAPDFVKIAVMPTDAADVLTLLSALNEFTRMAGGVPAIAIAMGAMGVVTRAAGGLFGSTVTYASLSDAAATAPGQINVSTLRETMRILAGDCLL